MTGPTSQMLPPARRGWVAAGALLILTLALVPLMLGAWQDENRAQHDRVLLGTLHDAIRYDDEVLTMSARMAAATGDATWFARYEAIAAQLNSSFGALVALDPHPELQASVAATSQANDALVAMEQEAFRLTRNGQGSQALRLLTSPEYDRLKAAYTAGNEAAFGHLAADLVAQEQAAHTRLALAATGLASTFTLTLAMAAWSAHRLQRARRAHLAEQLESLRQLSEYRGWFINNASHELATPLTPLRLQLEVVQRLAVSLANAQLDSSLQVIDRNVMRLASVLKEMLLVAELQSSSQLLLERVDLAALSRGALEVARASATRKGVTLVLQCPEQLEAVADARHVREVLLNLMANAVKSTPPGGMVRLRLSPSGRWCEIEVKDSGTGIPAADIPKIFTPFFHAESRHPEGAGLGLYLCKLLIMRHEGSITAESNGPGTGATFTVRIPLAGPERSTTPRRREEKAA